MATPIDLTALAAQQGPKVTLQGGIQVGEGGTGTAFSGFDDVSAVIIEVKVALIRSVRGAPGLTLLVESSTDGNSWSTAETFTFGYDGTQTVTLDSPDDYLRVRWTTSSKSEWYIDHVTAAPTYLEAPGGGATSVVSCVIARDSSVDIHDSGNHPILWDALYDNYQDFNTLTEIPAGLGLDFVFDGSSAEITTTEAGVWAFYYNFTIVGDNDWLGVLDTRFGQQYLLNQKFSGGSQIVALTLAIPSGTTFGPQFSTAVQATADPYNVGGVYLIATRLG